MDKIQKRDVLLHDFEITDSVISTASMHFRVRSLLVRRLQELVDPNYETILDKEWLIKDLQLEIDFLEKTRRELRKSLSNLEINFATQVLVDYRDMLSSWESNLESLSHGVDLDEENVEIERGYRKRLTEIIGNL